MTHSRWDKIYYISRGSLKLANKQFKTVQNDYEMTLNENSGVEEAGNEEMLTKFNFVPIYELGAYVNQRELIGKRRFLICIIKLFLFCMQCSSMIIRHFNFCYHIFFQMLLALSKVFLLR